MWKAAAKAENFGHTVPIGNGKFGIAWNSPPTPSSGPPTSGSATWPNAPSMFRFNGRITLIANTESRTWPTKQCFWCFGWSRTTWRLSGCHNPPSGVPSLQQAFSASSSRQQVRISQCGDSASPGRDDEAGERGVCSDARDAGYL